MGKKAGAYGGIFCRTKPFRKRKCTFTTLEKSQHLSHGA